MTADELSTVERSPLVEQHSKLFQPQILLAYKFHAHPLVSRVGSNRDFAGTQFLLRNYTDIRWDKRVTIFDLPTAEKYTEFTFKLQTRSSTFPLQPWDWELKVHPKGFSSANEEFRCVLSSSVILDQARSVEYLLTIVDDRKVLRSIAGKKNFTKTRYSTDLEMDKRVGIEELLAENSPLLVNGHLHMQLTLRPID
uniref:Uncharacterized protein n=1 Tax=Plectus sambesii TaxID=2011161 RepID=A0A914X047_9BILA